MRFRLGSSVLLVLACLATAVAPGRASAAADPAHIVSEQRVDARRITLTVATPAFTGGTTTVDVDLPVGYDADPARRWPVTYYLTGTNHHYMDFNDSYDGENLTKAYGSIVVMPDGAAGYWSDWYNLGAGGPPEYETFVIDQLIPLIDARFRTAATRSQRAILGESMGGYGVMMMAARHPDLFAAAASLSGAVDSNLVANGAVLSASPALQEQLPDSVYGPRALQEVRWHGHNPTDLVGNLRNVDLQVRSAEGRLDPSIGETASDESGCAVELAVHMATVDFDAALTAAGIAHEYTDYGGGCHSVPNFEREIRDALPIFTADFAHPKAAPASFDYASVEPAFDVWGWHVDADPTRALEFLSLSRAGSRGVTVAGSGTAALVSAPLFAGVPLVRLTGAVEPSAVPDAAGRIHFTVALGAADTGQQYAVGTTTTTVSRTVTFAPAAVAAASSTPVAAPTASRPSAGAPVRRPGRGVAPVVTTTVGGSVGVAQPAGTLAFTGADPLVALAGIGLLAAAAATRRRRSGNPSGSGRGIRS